MNVRTQLLKPNFRSGPRGAVVTPSDEPMGAVDEFVATGTSEKKKTKKGKKSKKKRAKGKNKAKESKKAKEAEKSTPAAEVEAVATGPIEGAQEIPGLFKVLRKDGKAWFALKPEQLNKPFFFSTNVSKSVGQKGLVGSEMMFGEGSQLAEFRRVDDRIQLVALQTTYFAEPGTPQERFVEEGFSDSLISSASVFEGADSEEAAESEESAKAGEEVLVEINELLFKDIPGYGKKFQRGFGAAFSMDVANSSFTAIDNSTEQTSFGIQAHFKGGGKRAPSTTPVRGSAFVEFRYNFLELPETPMKPRLADDRIGHFVTTRKDYTGDDDNGIRRYVNRWRLEKKNPDAEMSEPVKPITYWVANDVPEEYRESVRDGILEWNKAFEAIGFKDAIEVRQQTEADKFDTLDAAHASVRWYTASDVGSAVGPSHVDPRSGEILDADIRMADVFARGARQFIKDNPPAEQNQELEMEEHNHHHHHDGHLCQYQAHAGMEYEFAKEILEARGDTDVAEDLAQAVVKDTVMHEVGHTLGLRHNFKGSTIYTPEQLSDPEFTKKNGLGSSVMDYSPHNLAEAGKPQGEYAMSTLGVYDYLAIKYAYQPIDEATEKETLSEIAKLTTTDPKLAYESDEAADDMDPTVSRFDLGNNPLEYAGKEIRLARELWDRAQTQELPEGTSYKEYTRAFAAGLRKVAHAARLATRYVGGVTLRRDHAGTGNPIYEPIEAQTQREAVKLITDNVLAPDSFEFKPEFLSRLARDRFTSWGDQNFHAGAQVTSVQANAMATLLLDRGLTQRLIDNPEKVAEGTPTYSLGELYQTVQDAVWSELASGDKIPHERRELQRIHLLAVDKLIGPGSSAGEPRSMMRYLARQLKEQLDVALTKPMTLEQRAHLEESSHKLAETLDPSD